MSKLKSDAKAKGSGKRTNCHEAGVLHVLHVESNGNSRRLVRTPDCILRRQGANI